MARIKAVFFDAGDTLLHLWVPAAERLAWLCRQAGLPLPPDPNQVRAGAVALTRFLQARQPGVEPRTLEWYTRAARAALVAMGMTESLYTRAAHLARVGQELPQNRVVDPEAPGLLQALQHEGYRLAVVSNWDGSLESQLRAAGLAAPFAAILDSAVVGSAKPDPRIFDLACAALGVAPAEAVHVGDSPAADVAGARAAGVTPVLLDPLAAWAGALPDLPPWARIRRLSELPAVLDRLNQEAS